jgi:hypothetical protein
MPQNRRQFLRNAAVALAAMQVGLPRLAYAHTRGNTDQVQRSMMMAVAEDVSIRSFTLNVPDEALADLRARIAATR